MSRIYGYDNISNTIPKIVEQPVRMDIDMLVIRKIRNIISDMGYDEIITYSLLGRKLLKLAGVSDNNVVEIINPLTSEQEIMRPSLIAGMLNSILWNINRKTKDLKLFEIGSIYINEGCDKFIERRHLAAGITGQISSGWAGSRPSNFFDLKGVVEMLLSGLDIGEVSFKHSKHGGFSSAECASIEINKEHVGILGEIDKKVLDNFDIKDKVYFLEIDMESIIKQTKLEKHFKDLPRYPSIQRDISIVIGKNVLNSDILSNIKIAAGPILKEIKLIDRYAGKQIPDDKVGLTYRLEYQSLLKTLEEKDIIEIQAKVLLDLSEKLGAKLR